MQPTLLGRHSCQPQPVALQVATGQHTNCRTSAVMRHKVLSARGSACTQSTAGEKQVRQHAPAGRGWRAAQAAAAPAGRRGRCSRGRRCRARPQLAGAPRRGAACTHLPAVRPPAYMMAVFGGSQAVGCSRISRPTHINACSLPSRAKHAATLQASQRFTPSHAGHLKHYLAWRYSPMAHHVNICRLIYVCSWQR